MIDRKRCIRIRQALQAWYRAAARDLPWRRTTDPYAIWLSEVMLQQTRVSTAIPYYERFLRRFPTVSRLARARLDTVLKMWEGLGYYSRARNLHKAAREIVSRFHGRLPQTKEDLLTLPGVGRYTAGAIASIAFNERAPLVDGNVERVLCRVFRIHGSPKDAAIRDRIWSFAEELVPEDKAGLFNQALMELGSEICSPRRPRCDKCPLARSCEARIHKEQESLPARTARKPVPRHTIVVGVIYRAGRILIDKRKPEGLLGGLWEFPGGKVQPQEPFQAALRREIREELDIEIEVREEIATVEHTYAHFRVEIHAFECAHVQGDPRPLACAALKWVRPSDLSRYAFPAASKKIIEILRQGRT